MGTTAVRRALAGGMAAGLATWAFATPAIAGDHGDGGDGRQAEGARHGQAHAQAQGKAHGQGAEGRAQGNAAKGNGQENKAKGQAQGQGKAKGHGQGKAKGHSQATGGKSAQAPGQVKSQAQGPKAPQGAGASSGASASTGHEVVPGNNGTVKIANLGEMDGIPNNSPHPGCVFQVEWYGFDGGEDIVSTVSFTPQAPTADAGITVDGPTSVNVGGDAASGAGTDSGLDAVQAYTLSFTGTPHAQQGYHVKLTVTTPYSHGNDTKTKVFWVEPCETPGGPAVPGETPTTGVDDSDETGETGESGDISATESATANPSVLGSFAEAGAAAPGDEAAVAGEAARADDAAVPTSIEAGDDALLPSWARSPLALALIVAGGSLVALGLVLRQRRA